MHNFRFFEPYELEGKTPTELRRLALIDRGMSLDHEYDDLDRMTTDQLEALFKPKKPNPEAPKPPKVKRVAKPKRTIPHRIDEAFRYDRGHVYRTEYIDLDGERTLVLSPYPVDGTMRAQGLMLKWRGQYLALHRLVWFLVHGEWPDGRLIHLDGDKANNWAENLELEHRVKIHQTKAGFVVKVRDGVTLRELGTFDNRDGAITAVRFYQSINPLGKGKHLENNC